MRFDLYTCNWWNTHDGLIKAVYFSNMPVNCQTVANQDIACKTKLIPSFVLVALKSSILDMIRNILLKVIHVVSKINELPTLGFNY